MTVARRQRFTREHPCPVCGGYDGADATRGQGARCWGFASADGKWGHCTREEHAGRLERKPGSETFAHLLVYEDDGDRCPCGVRHDGRPVAERSAKGTVKKSGRPRDESKIPERPIAYYTYFDEDRKPRLRVVRFQPKGFKQQRYMPGATNASSDGWVWGLRDVEPVLYQLPDLLAADPDEVVYVVEGEKDAENLRRLGLVATTNPMGAGKWRDAYSAYLVDRKVAVLGDKDDMGASHVLTVARSVHRVARWVKVIAELPGLREKGADVSDWIADGGTAAELRQMVEAAPPFDPDTAPDPATVDKRSAIKANEPEIKRVLVPAAWEALRELNGTAPRLFRRAGVPSRVERDDEGRPVIVELNPDRMRLELSDAARWYTMKEDKETGKKSRSYCAPPMEIARAVLADYDAPLPPIVKVVEAPVFGPAGELQFEAGYHAPSRSYYWPEPGFKVRAVPDEPTGRDVAAAKRLFFEHLLEGFGFVEQADRANALALLLLPYVREMIDGPTPGHMIEAATPGTGKGLLTDMLLLPALGDQVGKVAAAENDTDWEKRLGSQFLSGRSAIVIDNINGTLASQTLAKAMTDRVFDTRRLGTMEMLHLPVRVVWVATANNPAMSKEIARRFVQIRLVVDTDRPQLRKAEDFKHYPLEVWAKRHRGELCRAALVLIRRWLADGRPLAKEPTLGSYAHWAAVMGGILGAIGVEGFLRNYERFLSRSDLTSNAWRAVVEGWATEFGSAEVSGPELWEKVASRVEELDVRGHTPDAQKKSFGKLLRAQDEVVYGEWRIVNSRSIRHVQHYQLIPKAERKGWTPLLGGRSEAEEPPAVSVNGSHGNAKTLIDTHNTHTASDDERVSVVSVGEFFCIPGNTETPLIEVERNSEGEEVDF